MSNFAFIADQFPSLAETAIGAEKLIYVYPPAGDCKIFCVNPILTQGFIQEYLHERFNRSFT